MNTVHSAGAALSPQIHCEAVYWYDLWSTNIFGSCFFTSSQMWIHQKPNSHCSLLYFKHFLHFYFQIVPRFVLLRSPWEVYLLKSFFFVSPRVHPRNSDSLAKHGQVRNKLGAKCGPVLYTWSDLSCKHNSSRINRFIQHWMPFITHHHECLWYITA